MKILLINGSPRKGNTLAVLQSLETKLKALEYETEIIHIKDYQVKTCIGCFKCVLDGKESCPFKADDADTILAKIIAADGLVLSAPVFALGIPGSFKNFIDRVAYNAHRPLMYNKPTVVVSTTAGMGTDYVIQQLKRLDVLGLKIVSALGFMVYPTGRDAAPVASRKDQKIRQAVTRFDKALRRRAIIKPTLIQVIQFYGLKLNSVFGRSAYKADYEYFKDRDFFVPAKIHPLKNLMGKLVYKIGTAALRKSIVINQP